MVTCVKGPEDRLGKRLVLWPDRASGTLGLQRLDDAVAADSDDEAYEIAAPMPAPEKKGLALYFSSNVCLGESSGPFVVLGLRGSCKIC